MDFVKHEHRRHQPRARGQYPPWLSLGLCVSVEVFPKLPQLPHTCFPWFLTCCLMVPVLCSPPPGSWSASTSPSPSPRYDGVGSGHRYGTTSLEQRSRSPSPGAGARGSSAHHRLGPQQHHHHHLPRPPSGAIPPPHSGYGPHGGSHGGPYGGLGAPLRPQQHSYPVLVTRRGQGRRLPPTPSKPSTLQLRPAPINFPQLNASPTHYPLPPPPQRDPPVAAYCPLSFEQAVAIGRGGRLLPSPVPNGYKPGGPGGPGQAQPPPHRKRSRHSDSDDDDWC